MANKRRFDQLLVERGLVPTRSKAQALILTGNVLVNDEPLTKAGTLLAPDVVIRIRGETHPYVSRAALKLKEALEKFEINPSAKTCLDIGASTGGFTEILLLRGAAKVYAVDVGHNQMDYRIRSDDRVICLEKVNARTLEYSVIGQTVDLVVVDVSFISLTKVLPALMQFMRSDTDLITLIKPQFEVGPENVAKGGVVKDQTAVNHAIAEVSAAGETLGLLRLALIDSPIRGSHGNQEYLAHWRRVN